MVLSALGALTAAAKAASVPGASTALLQQLLPLASGAGPRQSRQLHTALARSVVLPRLLDTLSSTFQQSSTRMDGLISNMTQELDRVGCDAIAKAARVVEAVCATRS